MQSNDIIIKWPNFFNNKGRIIFDVVQMNGEAGSISKCNFPGLNYDYFFRRKG